MYILINKYLDQKQKSVDRTNICSMVGIELATFRVPVVRPPCDRDRLLCDTFVWALEWI